MPPITTSAVLKLVSPNIGRNRCFILRWSCSIMLFKYVLLRTRTRFGNAPMPFSSATARCDAA
jgi:hypothetical protein